MSPCTDHAEWKYIAWSTAKSRSNHFSRGRNFWWRTEITAQGVETIQRFVKVTLSKVPIHCSRSNFAGISCSYSFISFFGLICTTATNTAIMLLTMISSSRMNVYEYSSKIIYPQKLSVDSLLFRSESIPDQSFMFLHQYLSRWHRKGKNHKKRLLRLLVLTWWTQITMFYLLSFQQALPIVTDPDMAERFERELSWCVGQLECMMRSSSSKDKDPRKWW